MPALITFSFLFKITILGEFYLRVVDSVLVKFIFIQRHCYSYCYSHDNLTSRLVFQKFPKELAGVRLCHVGIAV